MINTVVKPRRNAQQISNLELIEQVARLIKPDVESMSSWYQAYASNQRTRLASDLDIVQKYINKEGITLEFGAVPLLLTAALKERGYNVQGLDIAPERFATSLEELGLSVLKCDIETQAIPLRSNSVDSVIFNELFEHLRINLVFTLKEVHRIIKPGGLLLLSTPNLRSLGGILNFLLRHQAYSCCEDIYNQYDKLEKIGHMGHVREYTSKEVSKFLQKVGFETEVIIYRGQYYKKWQKLALHLFPSLHPYITIVARKV